MSVWWSIGLTAAGITGWWLAGSGPRWAPWGWMVGLAVQPFWIAFAIVSRHWGFILAGLFYAAVAARNLHRARRPQQGFASPTWDKTEDDPRHPVQRGTFGYAKDDDSNTWRPIVLADDGQLYTASVVQMWADSGRGEVAEGERVTFRPIPATVHHACTVPLLPDPPSGCAYCSSSGGKACRYHPGLLRGFDEALRTAPPALTRPLEGP